MINMDENLKALPVVNVHLDIDYALISATPIITAKSAIEFVSSKLFDSAKEKAAAIFLDATLAPICMASVGQGNQNNVMFSARDIVQTALLCNASYVTLIHNHPGINLTKKHCGPSKEDILVTDTIVKACDMVGVKVYDSIIASGEKKTFFGDMEPIYYSIREHNYTSLKKKFGIKDDDKLPLKEDDLKWERDVQDRTNGENIPDPAQETQGIEYIIPGGKDRSSIKKLNEEKLRASEKTLENHIKIMDLGFKNGKIDTTFEQNEYKNEGLENKDLASMIDK